MVKPKIIFLTIYLNMKKEVKTRNQEIYLSGELLIKRDLRRSHSKRLMLCSTLVLLNAFRGAGVKLHGHLQCLKI